MRKRKPCLRIEIGEVPWKEDLAFRVKVGDIDGSASSCNLTLKEALNFIKMEMEVNWKELEEAE